MLISPDISVSGDFLSYFYFHFRKLSAAAPHNRLFAADNQIVPENSVRFANETEKYFHAGFRCYPHADGDKAETKGRILKMKKRKVALNAAPLLVAAAAALAFTGCNGADGKVNSNNNTTNNGATSHPISDAVSDVGSGVGDIVSDIGEGVSDGVSDLTGGANDHTGTNNNNNGTTNGNGIVNDGGTVNDGGVVGDNTSRTESWDNNVDANYDDTLKDRNSVSTMQPVAQKKTQLT